MSVANNFGIKAFCLGLLLCVLSSHYFKQKLSFLLDKTPTKDSIKKDTLNQEVILDTQKNVTKNTFRKTFNGKYVIIHLDTAFSRYNDFKNYEFYIQGQTLCLSKNRLSTKIQYKPIDTLYFKLGLNYSKQICLVSMPKSDSISIRYNTCCDDFFLVPNNKELSRREKIIFKLKSDSLDSIKRNYFLTYGFGGQYIEKEKEIIYPISHSGMDSPIYMISLSDIEKYSSSKKSDKVYNISLYKSGKEANPDFKYKEKKSYFSIFYAPMSNNALVVDFNTENGKPIFYLEN